MYYIDNPYARLAYYENDLIILTLRDNKFHFIKNVPAESVEMLYAPTDELTESMLHRALYNIGALTKSRNRSSHSLSRLIPRNYVEERWMMPVSPDVSLTGRDIINALIALLRAACIVKFGGFKRIASSAGGRWAAGTPALDTDTTVRVAICSLNCVFPLDFSGNRCLTYSLALTLLLKRHIPGIKLVVGVRTRPFLSHAWVEHNKKVINDDPELRHKLAVILEI